MKRLVALWGMVFLVAATSSWAGEMVSPQHSFEVRWPSKWKRLPASETAQTLLFLEGDNGNWVFQIIVVEGATMGIEFLKSEDCVKGIYEKLKMKKVLLDTMTTIGDLPARKVIFQVDAENLCGLLQTIAHQRVYMVNAVARKVKFSSFTKTFDKMASGFRLKAQPGASPQVGKTPAVPPEPPKGKTFGSDF
jgi:hypothetical protein